MKNNKYFPVIVTQKIKRGYSAETALKLSSILHGSLFFRQIYPLLSSRLSPEAVDESIMQARRESFIRTLCSLPQSTTLELHLTGLPNLSQRPKGNLSISLLLQARAGTKHEAMEQAASAYLSLIPVLASHLPEAEFLPVDSEDEYKQIKEPFVPTHAASVCRKIQDIPLSQPLKRTSVGFLTDSSSSSQHQKIIRHIYPWVPSMDTWSMLTETMIGGLDTIKIIIRFNSASADDMIKNRLVDIISKCETFLSGGTSDHIILSRQVEQIRDIALVRLERLTELCCRLGVFLLAPHPIDQMTTSVLGQAITVGNGVENIFRGGFSSLSVPVEQILESAYFNDDELFTVQEAACAFRLPSPPLHDHSGLPVKRSRTNTARFTDRSFNNGESLVLFENIHRGMVQTLSINMEDRLRHQFIIGQTGTGKSTLMESQILQDIRAGRGVAVIDPHGDLVDGVLNKIPSSRGKDTIVFDVLDRTMPIGLNVFQYSTVEERDLLVDDLYRTIDGIYDMLRVGGPAFEMNYRGMCSLLFPEVPRDNYIPTLLEFTMCYQNKGFRKWLKESATDHQALDFIKELERTEGDWAIDKISPYITSKFNRFQFDQTLKRIVGQSRSSIDFNRIMDNSMVLLVKLGKGRFGSEVSALLANHIVSRFRLAAMKRGDMRPEDRKDFILYIDEVHNIPSENLRQLLSEARKYRLGLVLATQYATQLASTEVRSQDNLLSAVLGNCGLISCFRLGQQDARLMASTFSPEFSEEDIVSLPNYHGISRIQVSGDALPPFSFRSLMDKAPCNYARAKSIIEYSRMRYGKPIDEIDNEITLRRTSWRPIDPEDLDEGENAGGVSSWWG